jgi:uncharacterized protein YabE (DUF348 family)
VVSPPQGTRYGSRHATVYRSGQVTPVSAGTSPRLLRAVVTGIAGVLLVGGTGAWAATNRTITVTVDGQSRTLYTHAREVSRALAHAGIALGPHDAVAPHRDQAVGNGAEIIVERGRRVTAVVDGRAREFWTTARSVEDALADLGMRESRLRLSASRSDRLPLSGMRFEVRTEKRVTLAVHRDRRVVTSYAATVGELLTEQSVTLDPGDEAEPPPAAPLVRGTVVTVAHLERETRTLTVPIPAPVETRTDPELMLDQTSVVTPGAPGEEERTVEYTYADGTLRGTRIVSSRRTAEPRTEVVTKGSTPYPPDETGANWDALARCESGGRPDAVSPNGLYHGLYQFSVDTWQRTGGTGLPSEATPREQTYRAILLYERSGAGQWPHCGRYL